MRFVGSVCSCFGIGGIALACASAQPRAGLRTLDGAAIPACEACATRKQEAPAGALRTSVVGCEIVEPIEFEEMAPDGRVFEVREVEPEPRRLRLHVQLENLGDRELRVGVCNDALRIIDTAAIAPACGRMEAVWLSLPPGGALFAYPTLAVPAAPTEAFTTELVPLGECRAAESTIVPNMVTVRLTPNQCQPFSMGETFAAG